MGPLFSAPKAPPPPTIPPPAPMPVPDDPTVLIAQRQAAARASSTGRASTIMSDINSSDSTATGKVGG